MSNISWYQKTRLRAIETFAFWRGRVNSRDLTETFGISRVIALGDIHRYIELAPNNLNYHRGNKAFFATNLFKNELTTGDINEWMELDPGVCEYVKKPQFEIKPEIARPLIMAIHKNNSISIMYHSMEHPNGMKRSLFPHTLVYSGFRWHVRAWCCVRKEFRDFNLSRITHVVPLDEPRLLEAHPSEDALWHKIIDIQLKANPNLSKQERSLIEKDFGMIKNRLTITTRSALVMYTLQVYQVDIDQNDNVYKQRLVLANTKNISAFLWKKV